MLTALAFCVSVQLPTEPIVTPYFRKDPLAIRSIEPLQLDVKRFGIEEYRVDLGATYDNPFDPQDVSLDANVVAPSGAAYSIPGFLYRPYSRALKDGTEVLAKTGEPEWRLRICPMEVGEYTVTVALKDRTGAVSAPPVHFRAGQTDSHGLVRVSPRNRQYFEYSDGASCYPIGANVCWGNAPGTFSYDAWIPAFAKQGANYMRLWLGPSWVTFAPEQAGKPEEGKGMGQFDLGNLWRLDEVLDKARSSGIYAMVTIDSYNTLRAHNAYPNWDKAPQNRDNGGPLRIWTDFWTNSIIATEYKAKLRYLVARYAAYSNLFSWEFWNEVDITEDYSADVVQAWHQRMGDVLRALDPYHHLVTTSMADSMGNRSLDLLPQLDYVQTHSYNNPDVALGLLYQQARKAEWGKPHIVAEIGADASGPRADIDPGGMQIHDPLWMSVVAGCSGSAMSWWWDNLIAPKNLYPLYGAIARFTNGIDWPGEDFRRADVQIGYAAPPKTPQWKDLVFESGPVQWTDGDSNRPHIVTVIQGKPEGDLPLPGIQHGVRNHREWHNPILFKVSLRRNTRFEVLVGDVSGFGGGTLQLSLDGDPVMTRDFPAPDDGSQGATLTKYEGHYGLDVPAGDHSITVENVGKDWFMAGYRFINLIKRTGPPLQAWALVGNSKVLVWARPEGRTWRNIIVDKKQIPPVESSLLSLEGLSSGRWHVELWDTWRGTPSPGQDIHVGIDGRIRLQMPAMSKDLAVKLTKIGAGK